MCQQVWLVQGSTADLVIDTGIGLLDLPGFLKQKGLIGNKPVTAVANHTHFDHSGGLHQFENFAIHNLLPRVPHLTAPWSERSLGLITCLPESGRWQIFHWREGRLSKNFVYTESTGVRDVLSPKPSFTRFDGTWPYVVLRQCLAIIFCKHRRKRIHRLLSETKVAEDCAV